MLSDEHFETLRNNRAEVQARERRNYILMTDIEICKRGRLHNMLHATELWLVAIAGAYYHGDVAAFGAQHMPHELAEFSADIISYGTVTIAGVKAIFGFARAADYQRDLRETRLEAMINAEEAATAVERAELTQPKMGKRYNI